MRIATCHCGARWHDNHGASHCAACNRTFASLAAFDAHRHHADDGGRACHDPSVLRSEKTGALVFAARTDGTGATVWEHAANAARTRARFKRPRPDERNEPIKGCPGAI